MKIALTGATALALAACGQPEPSERDIQAAVLKSWQAKGPLLNWQVAGVKKYDCASAGEGRVRCRYAYRVGIQVANDAKEASSLFEYFGDHWQLVGD